MGIEVDAVASYVDRAVEAMADIVDDLGDELANARPGLPGANSPYVILLHCLGVMEFWAGQVVAGRTVDRDREAEFRASGAVADLIAAARDAQRRFRADIVTADPKARPRAGDPSMGPDELEFVSQGHALLHVLEEVCQHLGQMEITATCCASLLPSRHLVLEQGAGPRVRPRAAVDQPLAQGGLDVDASLGHALRPGTRWPSGGPPRRSAPARCPC